MARNCDGLLLFVCVLGARRMNEEKKAKGKQKDADVIDKGTCRAGKVSICVILQLITLGGAVSCVCVCRCGAALLARQRGDDACQSAVEYGEAEAQRKGGQMGGAAAESAANQRGGDVQSNQDGCKAKEGSPSQSLAVQRHCVLIVSRVCVLACVCGYGEFQAWKRMVTKHTFVGQSFTRLPPKYERFVRYVICAGPAKVSERCDTHRVRVRAVVLQIRPTGLRVKKAHVVHPTLKSTFCLVRYAASCGVLVFHHTH